MFSAIIGVAVLFFLGVILALSHYSLIIPVLLFFLGVHLAYFGKATVKLFVNLGFLLVILMFITDLVRSSPQVSPLYIPVASFIMLTMLLFNDLQLVFLMAFISSVLVTLMTGGAINFMITFFLSSLVGAYTVKGARTRGRLITAGIYVGLIQVLCALLLDPVITHTTFDHVIKPLLLNGVISFFVVVSTLKIFETIFGEITHFTLLELADSSSQPLLNSMLHQPKK